jgi:hypothetical protein
MAKVANIIAIYTKTRNIILEFQSLGNTIELFLILFPTLATRARSHTWYTIINYTMVSPTVEERAAVASQFGGGF